MSRTRKDQCIAVRMLSAGVLCLRKGDRRAGIKISSRRRRRRRRRLLSPVCVVRRAAGGGATCRRDAAEARCMGRRAGERDWRVYSLAPPPRWAACVSVRAAAAAVHDAVRVPPPLPPPPPPPPSSCADSTGPL